MCVLIFIKIPIDGFIASVSCCLCCSFVGKPLQLILPFHSQFGNKCVENIRLGIYKRVVYTRTHSHLLSDNEIIWFSVHTYTLSHFFKSSCPDCRLPGLPKTVVDQGNGHNLTTQHACRCAEEDIRIGADLRIRAGCADAIGSGEFVVVLVAPFP